MRLSRSSLVLATPLLLAAVACAPVDDTTDNTTDTASDSAGSTSSSAAAETCTPDSMETLTARTLTIGTDSPAYDPWFSKNDPTNGKGYESAVAYAVAEQLGYTADQVTWVKVPFNSSYKPGPKDFDFDI
ncbi:MAG: amino acid ABC transporter substrate-binding protein, partial [Nocardioidaceae bacterium]|nr:amino acid ABC transporter substrate-binding protein [Nocardioidaceae bacterium]